MELDEIRKKIDKIDREIIDLVAQRYALMPYVAEYKKRNNIPIKDEDREKLIFNKLRQLAIEKQVNPLLIHEIYKMIIDESCIIQKRYLEAELK